MSSVEQIIATVGCFIILGLIANWCVSSEMREENNHRQWKKLIDDLLDDGSGNNVSTEPVTHSSLYDTLKVFINNFAI